MRRHHTGSPHSLTRCTACLRYLPCTLPCRQALQQLNSCPTVEEAELPEELITNRHILALPCGSAAVDRATQRALALPPAPLVTDRPAQAIAA